MHKIRLASAQATTDLKPSTQGKIHHKAEENVVTLKQKAELMG